MPGWSAASVPYFIFITAAALIAGDLPRSSRILAAGSAGLGLALALTAGLTEAFWLRSLVLPAIVLLIAYRASGFLWRGPMFGIEAKLAAADHALGIPALVRSTPPLLAEFLEFAYFGVYPIIPIALALHLMYSPAPDADLFWTVVLVTDYVCFAMLPFIQTRPPRALETSHPWAARLRGVNLRILNHASIRMNTVPSGHAAEALAAALLVLAAPPVLVAAMFAAAAAISVGAVLGRYHYAIDIIAGWVTALGVWIWLGGRFR
jgi:membrane-associated phospholipid phosphatase